MHPNPSVDTGVIPLMGTAMQTPRSDRSFQHTHGTRFPARIHETFPELEARGTQVLEYYSCVLVDLRSNPAG